MMTVTTTKQRNMRELKIKITYDYISPDFRLIARSISPTELNCITSLKENFIPNSSSTAAINSRCVSESHIRMSFAVVDGEIRRSPF